MKAECLCKINNLIDNNMIANNLWVKRQVEDIKELLYKKSISTFVGSFIILSLIVI